MPIYVATMIQKPRYVYRCDMCGVKIDGRHVTAFGCGIEGDPPYRTRLCMECSRRSAAAGSPRLAEAIETGEAKTKEQGDEH